MKCRKIVRVIAVVGALGTAALASPAIAVSPAPGDFAACNAEAASKTEAPSALPGPPAARGVETEKRPDRGGKSEVTSPPSPGAWSELPRDPTGRFIKGSSDPLYEGMEVARAEDPGFVTKYRECMRKRGF